MLIVPLYIRYEAVTTQPVYEDYTEASTKVYPDPMVPLPDTFTEIYTETYTDVYTEKYTEVFTIRPNIYTEIFTDVYPGETYTETFTDLYEDVYQNEYQDQSAKGHAAGDNNVTPGASEMAEKQDKSEGINQLKGMSN